MLAPPIQRSASPGRGREEVAQRKQRENAQPRRREARAPLVPVLQRACRDCEQAAPRWQARYAVHGPGDRWEREADQAADAVVHGTPPPRLTNLASGGLASGVQRLTRPPTPGGRERPRPRTPGHGTDPLHRVLQQPGAGTPLPAAHRQRLQGPLGAELAGVRIHTGPEAEAAAAAIQARAFTSGRHIWLGPGESPSDLRLIAHEAAHTVQQGAVPARSVPGNTRTSPTPAPAPPPRQQVQRWSWRDLTPDFIEAGIDLVGEAVSFTADLAWSAVSTVAPGLARIIQQVRTKGIVGYLGDVIRSGLGSIFNGLRDQGGTVAAVAGFFAGVGASAADILGNLAAGNCGPVFAAIDRLKTAIAGAAGEVWNGIVDFFRPVGDFFSGLWTAFDQSVLAWLRQIGSDAWQFLEQLGATIWSYVEPVKNAVVGLGGQIWDWVEDQLGIGGEGDDGEGGLMAWVQARAEEAWTGIREQLQPVIAPIQGLVARVREILPLDAILNLRESLTEWLGGIAQTATAIQAEDGVVENQSSLREEILPAILASIGRLRLRVVGAGAWIAGKIGAVAGAVVGFIATVTANPLISLAAGALGWLQERVQSLAASVTGVVGNVFAFLDQGLDLVARFLRPILDVLTELISLVGDLLGRLMSFVTGALWGWIPACIRQPIQDFIVNQILRRIPVFSQLLDLPDIWARVQNIALRILRQVFVDGDLLRAAWTFFSSILEVLGLPGRLVLGILTKAATAIGDIITNPVGFFINLLSAVKAGFERFFGNIWANLLSGFTNWLFGALGDLNIAPPRDFSLRSILGLVFEILGVSVERVFQKLESKIGPEPTRRLRQALQVATGVWRFVVILVEEGPAGLWRELVDRLSDLWGTVRDAAINWIVERVTLEASRWLLGLLDISGITPVINSLIAIYRAIESAVQYLRQMLEIVERVLDGILQIARGVIDTAAGFIEGAIVRSLPVVIGFLANQLGLGSLPRRLGEIIAGIRERVDQALDWLIDRAVETGRSILDTLRAGVEAAMDWLGLRRAYRNAGGETHQLYFRGQADQARLTIESTPRPLEAYLDDYENTKNPTPDERAAITQIRARIAEIENIKSANRTRGRGSFTQADGESIRTKYDAIVTLLGVLRGDGTAPPPSQIIERATLPGSGDGTRMVAHPLSLNPGGLAGGQPFGESPLWLAVSRRKRRAGAATFYVRGHLLNHHLHGAGSIDNMIPITSQANGQMERLAESQVKQAVLNRNQVVRYEVEAIFGGHSGRVRIPEEGRLPTRIRMVARPLHKPADTWVEDPAASAILPQTMVPNTLPGEDEGHVEPAEP